MSDQVIISMIGSLIALIGTIFTGFMAFKMAQLNHKAAEAAKVLETATHNTEVKLDNIAKVGDTTHNLVNSAMLTQLSLNSIMAERIANLTDDEEDRKASDLAKKMFAEHEAKQRQLDAKELGASQQQVDQQATTKIVKEAVTESIKESASEVAPAVKKVVKDALKEDRKTKGVS